ncbi:MAG: GDYXXLXY domain-containing protein [Nanoarchaeota archaeon]|nr:GDYXXLXY domain-containing protein [Nanoarchaeota archaeon]
MKPVKRLIITLLILFGIAGGFILYLAQPYMNGTPAVLKTVPVDPFDMFRGQYLILRYEITTLTALPNITEGATVYVQLKENEEGIFEATGTTQKRPTTQPYIKGTVTSVYNGKMTLEYGIEQYFFEQNAEFLTDHIDVEILISEQGQARIRQLLRYGKPLEITYKNVSITS